MVSSTCSHSMPAASSASRTAVRAAGSVITSMVSPSRVTSSAPPSMAASMTSSSLKRVASTVTEPRRSKIQATAPGPPRLPLCLVKMLRTSAAERLRLSVSTSTMTATPLGP